MPWINSMRTARLACLLTAAGLLVACSGGDNAERVPAPAAHLPNFTGLVEQTAPSVVNVSTAPSERASQRDGESRPELPGPLGEWFDRFFDEMPGPRGDRPGPPMPHQRAQGSGFVIDEAGYILTNRHVVRNGGEIVVKFNDRREMVAELIGSDEHSDIALLKVEADDLEAAKIGEVKDLAVGSWVVAIGSPFGFETSVTAGIVSAKRRNLASDQYVPFIQTDVAINPGNSGGPLFNLDGEVVGINSQIYSRSGGYQGVSFAIPIDMAMDVVAQLRDDGEVRRGWLGVQIQEVNRELAESFEMDRPHGALVAHVFPDSPAAEAGLKTGDIIVGFDGEQVASAAALPPMVGTIEPGDSAPMRVLRDGDHRSLTVEVGKLDEEKLRGQRPDQPESQSPGKLGLGLRGLREPERAELGLESGGAVVTAVESDAARRAGLRTGDVIVSIGGQRVKGPDDLRARLTRAQGAVPLLVRRDGSARFLAFDPTG